MTQNRVVIFSNGIADFQRSYQVKADAPQHISIPVKQPHLADVLASLTLFGDVKLEAPPSFRPENISAGTLNVIPSTALEQLAVELCGAEVQVQTATKTVTGTLVGLHSEEQSNGGEKIIAKSLVVLSSEGLTRVPIKDVQNLAFTQETVQKEIEKALQRRFQQIKPESTFVDLTLSTSEGETEAVLQYTIPAAAWKISYRLRCEEDGITFQGFAIVDNNTDEDWEDFQLAVVTGEPISFTTDLAMSKQPHRRHVDMVKDEALGAVEVESAMLERTLMGRWSPEEDAVAMDSGVLHASGDRMMKRSASSGGVGSATPLDQADASEVGDFCIMESSSPVSIAGNRSAVIPLFQVSLSETKRALHYKFENHPDRAFRAIRFHNETDYSLTRGVCTVYESGTYAGNCIIPMTKIKGDALLPHALETGVLFRRENKRAYETEIALRVNEGVYTVSRQTVQVTEYQIKNQKADSFSVVLDHLDQINQPKRKCELIVGDNIAEVNIEEKLKSGFRVCFELSAEWEVILRVTESRVNTSRIGLINHSKDEYPVPKVGEMLAHLLKANGPLAESAELKAALAVQAKVDHQLTALSELSEQITQLVERQERLRENLKAIAKGSHDEQTNRWLADLGTTEDQLLKIQEELKPACKQELAKLRAELVVQLKKLSLEWTAE